MKRWMKHALLLAAAGSIATVAVAQEVVDRFPANLNWQTMSLLAFNLDYERFKGTQGETDVAWSIWGPTIEAFPVDSHFNDNNWPAFILLKGFEDSKQRYIFTSMSAASLAYPSCTDGINSKNPDTPIYTMCPMRLIVKNKTTGKEDQSEHDNFCHIAANSEDLPKSENYEQVAVDSATKTAYFRVVQYGKPAPECNRAIKLP